MSPSLVSLRLLFASTFLLFLLLFAELLQTLADDDPVNPQSYRVICQNLYEASAKGDLDSITNIIIDSNKVISKGKKAASKGKKAASIDIDERSSASSFVNTCNSEQGETALMGAAFFGRTAAIKALLEAGARIDHQAKVGIGIS